MKFYEISDGNKFGIATTRMEAHIKAKQGFDRMFVTIEEVEFTAGKTEVADLLKFWYEQHELAEERVSMKKTGKRWHLSDRGGLIAG